MNYELLRPFDLEAAKAGAKITDTRTEYTLIAEAGPDGDMAVRDPDGNLFVMHLSDARMAPLAWVEDKPVYPGDVLYWSEITSYPKSRFTVGSERLVGGMLAGRSDRTDGTTFEFGGMYPYDLTWDKPPVKREGWINLYPKTGSSQGRPVAGGQIHPTKAVADKEAFEDRIACVRIEWEE